MTSLSYRATATATASASCLRSRVPNWAELTADDIAIHPLVNGVMHLHAGLVAKAVDQEPRAVYVSDNDRPSRNRNAVPLVHWTVKERFDTVTDYRPAALRGLRFRLLLEDGQRSDVMEGIAGLREYQPSGGQSV